MRKTLLIIVAIATMTSLFAQTESRKLAEEVVADLENTDVVETAAPKWTVNGILTLNTSATGFVNWASGGNNSVNVIAAANVTLLYKDDNVAWETNLDTDYGLAWLSGNKYPWRKTNDKLNFSTKFGWEFAKTWYATAAGTFKTQFADGYDYKTVDGVEKKIYTSTVMSPSYTDLSLGVDWKPNSIFSVYMAPVTGRISTAFDSTLRANYIAPVVDKTFKAELGFSLKGTVNYTLIENLKVLSTLTLFTPYSTNFGKIDVDWDFAISYQFLKVLNVSLGTQLKYYDSVLIADKDGHKAPRVQFKTVFGLGIGYSF